MATLAPPRTAERSAWRAFAVALVALAGAMALALYSSAAAVAGQVLTASLSAISALGIAAWVAITIVPVLARRTALNWLSRTEYSLTREGVIYLGGLFIVALAAVNTGNNLLFMILSCLLAGILVSGVLSQIVLSRIELRLELPEHIFAGQPVVAITELVNHKPMLPSFSLRLTGAPPAAPRAWGKQSKEAAVQAPQILSRPVYFPYLPHRQSAQQSVELLFPRRGLYRQDALKLATRFPFSFLEKARRIPSDLRVVVYPAVEPTEEFYEILPLVSGELESYTRGRGHDLYGIRPYQTSDSARHVDWKASAKTGRLLVREFSREDERRVVLVFDAQQPALVADPQAVFERGIGLAASLAWHFYEIDSVLGFRGDGFEAPLAPAGEVIYDVLDHLATAAPTGREPSRPSATPARTFSTRWPRKIPTSSRSSSPASPAAASQRACGARPTSSSSTRPCSDRERAQPALWLAPSPTPRNAGTKSPRLVGRGFSRDISGCKTGALAPGETHFPHEPRGCARISRVAMPPHAATKNIAAPLGIATAPDLPALRASLLGWYRRHRRDLDWRRTSDPYRIWVSEVMLQQTRVAAVTDYYRRWVARFPTVESLARAPLDAVLRQWAGLGYYSRARNLHRAAREIVARHDGKFPRRLDDALALPGIGVYTAAAVLSIAYGQPLAVVDGNVARVLARLAALRGDVRAPRAWRRLAATAAELLDARAPGDWNQALMELGATLCAPRAPRCAECPMAGPDKGWCRAHALGIAERIPAPRRKPAAVRLSLAAAVLLDPRGRTLLLRQQDDHAALFSRLWQFPAVALREPNNGAATRGAKKNGRRALTNGRAPERNDRARRALSGHLKRSFGLAEAALEPLASARHAVTFRNIRLLPFLLRVEALPRLAGARTPRLTDVARLSVSSATRKIARAALAAL